MQSEAQLTAPAGPLAYHFLKAGLGLAGWQVTHKIDGRPAVLHMHLRVHCNAPAHSSLQPLGVRLSSCSLSLGDQRAGGASRGW